VSAAFEVAMQCWGSCMFIDFSFFPPFYDPVLFNQGENKIAINLCFDGFLGGGLRSENCLYFCFYNIVDSPQAAMQQRNKQNNNQPACQHWS